MQESGWDLPRVRAALLAARGDDHTFSDGSIMGSMCTEPHRIARDALAMFAETNLGDPDHFAGTAVLETEVLEDILLLLNAPAEAGARFMTGGTEANLWALYIAREKTGKREVVLPEHAHFSFEKAARLLGMKLVWVPSGRDHRANVKKMMAATGPDTALVVAVAGSTELGLVDPISELAAKCAKAELLLHVDAAFGGYVIPFLPSPIQFDFELPGVWSVSLDPHKMGQSIIPAGILALRDDEDWNEVAVETPYVSTDKQSQLLGTRPGAAPAATWAVHRALGRTGFRAATDACFDVRDKLIDGLATAGYVLVAPPELNVVTFKVANAQSTMTALQARGIRVNVVPRFNAIRIVVGPHVTEDAVDRLLNALESP